MQNFSDSCFAEDSKDMYMTIYITAQLLFFTLSLLFGEILIAVVIVVCLSCVLFLCILVHYFKLFDAYNDNFPGFT